MESYNIIVVFALFIASGFNAMAAPEDLYKEYAMTCAELFTPQVLQQACHEFTESFKQYMTKCGQKFDEPWSCDASKCLIGGPNSAGMSDNVDETKLKDYFDQLDRNDTESVGFAHRLQTLCTDRKYDDYLPNESCSPLKYQICVYANTITMLLKTKEGWQTTDGCSKIYETTQKCKTVLDKMAD